MALSSRLRLNAEVDQLPSNLGNYLPWMSYRRLVEMLWLSVDEAMDIHGLLISPLDSQVINVT